MEENQPVVSVVTPVYNGARYLRECIESVIGQTYRDWEYLIVDNQSTDTSLELARAYAAQDRRIRVHSNERFLPLMANWNHAMRLISPRSRYCKVVHADDLLFPNCLMRMVAVAEGHPSVGIVGAYRVDEDRVNLDDMTYPTTVVPGREMCRRRLMGGADMFGSPSSILYRAGLVRERKSFYNEDNPHADSEVCFELLRDTDFGFVHQVLSYTRRHNEAETSAARRLNTHKVSHLLHMAKYGPVYLKDEEYSRLMRRAKKTYYRFLGKTIAQILTGHKAYCGIGEFVGYHAKAAARLGHPLSYVRLIGATLAALYNKGLDLMKV